MQSANHPGMGSTFFAERPKFTEGRPRLESNRYEQALRSLQTDC